MIAGLFIRLILLAEVLIVSSTVMSAQPPGVAFGMTGIANGQSARANALNLGNAPAGTADTSSCTVTFQFLDADGQLLKQAVVTLKPGKAGALDLSRDELPSGSNSRIEIRALLLFGYSGGANPPPGVLQKFDCNIVPSLEVFDNDTGRTSLIVTQTKRLPPTPAQ
jgi:hypothetical protein